MCKVLLCILDGVGENNNSKGNAVNISNTPNLNYLKNKYGFKSIEASGEYVGLPDGQMGNSEVGHMVIGAGKILYQPLQLINKSIEDGSFFSNKSIINAINHAKENNSKLHIMGLLSDGGVHSHINHFKAILKCCYNENFKNVYFNIFTDGRDTYIKSSKKYLDDLQMEIDKYGIGVISSICGRYYSMDRDKRFDRVKEAYESLVYPSTNTFKDYNELINYNYKNNITDEFIKPGVITNKGVIEDNDSIIWVNFRPDRAIEILSSFNNSKFNGFETKKIKNLYLTTMMYVNDSIVSDIAFKQELVDNSLGIYLSKLGKKQLRIAETEKYAHVTYFFDGGRDIDLKNCNRILIPSPKVTTYDKKPEMSAYEITYRLLLEMKKDYDFILLNFANGDMVGHTGNIMATKKAIEVLDDLIGKIYKECEKENYLFIITADHGNAELMLDSNDNVVTSHTTNKVPFIVCKDIKENNVEKLSDIAPFILRYMNLKIPDEML